MTRHHYLHLCLAVLFAALAGGCLVETGDPVELDEEVDRGIEPEEEVAFDDDTLEAEEEIARPPPRSDCLANYQKCLSSGLGGAPGGQPGHSRCLDCYDICRGSGWWPDRTSYGGDCRWWLY